jgi:hypothetical protein
VFPLSGGTMNHAITLSNITGYYIGNMQTVNSIDTGRSYTYSYNVGFLMSYTIDSNSCIKGGNYVYPTAVTFTTTYSFITSYSPVAT